MSELRTINDEITGDLYQVSKTMSEQVLGADKLSPAHISAAKKIADNTTDL